MPTIEELRNDLRSVLQRCTLIAPEFAVNYQADAIMRMLDEKYISLAQMEAEAEGVSGPK